MKQPKNKFIAICIYFAPYVVAIVSIVLYAVFVNLFRNLQTDEMLIEQPILNNLLTYAPISVAFIVIAIFVSKKIRERLDLSVIGIKSNEKAEENSTTNVSAPKEKTSKFSFLILAICFICMFVSIGFACSYSALKVKKVGGSKSYYITDSGFMGIGKSETVISNSVKWEFDETTFTIKLKNGNSYKIKKDSKAGKAFSELVDL